MKHYTFKTYFTLVLSLFFLCPLNAYRGGRGYRGGYGGYGAALAIPLFFGLAASASSRDRDYTYDRRARRDRYIFDLKRKLRTLKRELSDIQDEIDAIKNGEENGNIEKLTRKKERLERRIENIEDHLDQVY